MNLGAAPPPTVPPSKSDAQSGTQALLDREARVQAHLRRLLDRGGVLAISDDTEEGKLIHQLYNQFYGIGAAERPDITKAIGAEVGTLALLMFRSLSVSLITLKAPPSGSTKAAANKRATFKAASAEAHKWIDDLAKAMKLLGVKGFGGEVANETPDKSARDLLLEMQERVLGEQSHDQP